MTMRHLFMATLLLLTFQLNGQSPQYQFILGDNLNQRGVTFHDPAVEQRFVKRRPISCISTLTDTTVCFVDLGDEICFSTLQPGIQPLLTARLPEKERQYNVLCSTFIMLVQKCSNTDVCLQINSTSVRLTWNEGQSYIHFNKNSGTFLFSGDPVQTINNLLSFQLQ